MIRIIIFNLLILLFASCASLGSKTVYKREVKMSFRKFGFAYPDKDTAVSKLFTQTDSIFIKSITETFPKNDLTVAIVINNQFSFSNPDTKAIKKICAENNLDGFVVSRIKFIHVTYTVGFIPVAKNYDTEFEMKLFNKDGRIDLIVLHNTTKGNSYIIPPPARRTIYDGTKGAVKRMMKELDL